MVFVGRCSSTIALVAVALVLTVPAGTAQGRVPSRLVGTWASQGGDASLVYRFARTGRYAFSGDIVQERSNGTWSYSVETHGRVSVKRNRLVLHPKGGTTTTRDPDTGTRKRRASRATERYTWSVRRGVLSMTDADGNTVTYDRA